MARTGKENRGWIRPGKWTSIAGREKYPLTPRRPSINSPTWPDCASFIIRIGLPFGLKEGDPDFGTRAGLNARPSQVNSTYCSALTRTY